MILYANKAVGVLSKRRNQILFKLKKKKSFWNSQVENKKNVEIFKQKKNIKKN